MDKLNFKNRVNKASNSLSKNELNIAQYILNNEKKATNINISDLALITKTSTASVTRLIQKLQYDNFNSFKTILKQEQASLNETTNISYIDSISNYYNETIKSAIDCIDKKVVSKFCNKISKSNRVIIIGLGSSLLSATEFKYRLSRMGIIVDVISDPSMMLMQISILDKNDLIICITNSGSSTELHRACKLAQANKTPIYTITTKENSLITNLSSCILFTSNNSFNATSLIINSQVTIIFAIDCITYSLLENEKYFTTRLKTIEDQHKK